jgi:hypothetical protein
VHGSEAEERLIMDLFRGYNHLIRPVPNVSSTPLEIRFSLALILLINVDEKNQIMQTNVWPTMRWVDYQMQWLVNFEKCERKKTLKSRQLKMYYFL